MLSNKLYKVKQHGVAKKVNDSMQKSVPPGTSKEIKSKVCLWGLKQGATIDTDNHDGVSIQDAVARIGHFLGNIDGLYRDYSNPLHGIQAA